MRDRSGVFSEDARARAQDICDLLVTSGRRRKDNRRQHRNFHFARDLRPTDEFIQVVQAKRAQDFVGEFAAPPVQIVIAQDGAQHLQRQIVSAASVAQDVPPAAGPFDAAIAPPRDGRSSPGVYRNTVTRAERRGEAGLAIAAGHDRGFGPDFSTESRQIRAIRGRPAAG